MIRKTRLFTPGPTPLLPAAQFAMAAADLHHRTPEFRALYVRVLEQLRTFIGTKNDVILMACSGSGVMEASVANITSPGDRVLVLSAGKFGERWTGIAKAYNCDVDLVSAPYGQTFSLDAVKAALKVETRAVYMQANESSTGTRHDVEGVAKLLKDAKSDAVLVVDAITGLGTTHFDADAWGVDIMIGGSQKAVMIPPGLAYCSVSEKAWELMGNALNPRYYFDLRKERKNAAKGESSYTPAISLIAGLSTALDYIASQADGDLAAGRAKLVDNAETHCRDDARGRGGAGAEAVLRFAGCRVDGGAAAGRRGLRRGREGAEVAFRRDHHQRPGRDEGPVLPHRAHRLLRLSGHDRDHWRVGAGGGEVAEAAGLRLWQGTGCRAADFCGAHVGCCTAGARGGEVKDDCTPLARLDRAGRMPMRTRNCSAARFCRA